MATVRIKGLKRYRSKDRWYSYHRATGKRIEAAYGTAAFVAEIALLEERIDKRFEKVGTVGALLASYRGSRAFRDLAPSSRGGYSKIMNILQPIDGMPLLELTAPFIASLRDKVADQKGRRTANFVLAILSVASEHGRERGLMDINPVKGIRRVRRDRLARQANRPWTRDECRVVLDNLPPHLALPVALAMFTGLRQGDVLSLEHAAVRDGRIWRRTDKTGSEVSLPLHEALRAMIPIAASTTSVMIATNAAGRPWTSDGFRTSFGKAMKRLEADGKIEAGLTFHGLRHTVGTLLREITDDLDLIRRWLGQSTISMAQHYSKNADVSGKMAEVAEHFDPLGTKARTKVSNC